MSFADCEDADDDGSDGDTSAPGRHEEVAGVQWDAHVRDAVAFNAAAKARYPDDVAEASKKRTAGRDPGHLYDHHVFDATCPDCVDANTQAEPCLRGGSASLIPPDRILYCDFLGKKVAKALSARGHALPYNGSQHLLVAGRYKDGKGPALLWVGALKSREEEEVVEGGDRKEAGGGGVIASRNDQSVSSRDESTYDLVICSDCFYDAASFPGLFRTIEGIVTKTRGQVKFLFGYKLRHAAREAAFFRKLEQQLGANLHVFGQAAVSPRNLRHPPRQSRLHPAGHPQH